MTVSSGDKLGPYEIVALIGAGGMGAVYRARDARLNRDVAIKISQEKFSGRFEHEARAVAALSHPNICTLFDAGPDYLVMELVAGEPPKGPMPLLWREGHVHGRYARSAGLFVVSAFRALGGLTMVTGGMLVMLGSSSVAFRGVVVHRRFLVRGKSARACAGLPVARGGQLEFQKGFGHNLMKPASPAPAARLPAAALLGCVRHGRC